MTVVTLKGFIDSRTKDFAPGSIVNDQSPLPERLTVDVLTSALSPMVTLPVFEPFVVGVNVIFIRQLPPGERVVLLVRKWCRKRMRSLRSSSGTRVREAWCLNLQA
jgi:hypothetical protein